MVGNVYTLCKCIVLCRVTKPLKNKIRIIPLQSLVLTTVWEWRECGQMGITKQLCILFLTLLEF